MRAVSTAAAAAAAAVVQHAPKRHGQPCRQQRQHDPFQPAHASDDQQQELIQPRRNAPCYNALEHRNDCAAQPAAANRCHPYWKQLCVCRQGLTRLPLCPVK